MIMNSLLLLFIIIIATIAATAGLMSANSTIINTNNISTTTLTAFTTSAYTHHHHHHAATNSFKTQHGRLTMVEDEIFFQIHSSEKDSLCIEVFKSLENVGRLWLRPCKSKGERGVERQMFGVTKEGKLHPSTKPSSCIFLYNNKNLRYRKDCIGILHNKKNQFMFDFFDGTIFLLGDVTKVVMTVRKLEEKKGLKLQRGSPTKSMKQHWTLRFEIDRIMQPAASCNSPTPTMPSGKYSPSSKSTNTPPISLPARSPTYPSRAYPPTTYQQITTRKDFNIYVYIWLKNNMEDEYASDTENELYRSLLEKYGDIDVFQVLFLPTPLFDFLQDETLQLLVRLMFRRMRETWSDRERKFYYNMWNRIIGFTWGFKSYPPIYDLISPSDRKYTFWVWDRVRRDVAKDKERVFYNWVKAFFGDPKDWSPPLYPTSSPTLKPTSKPTSLSVPPSSSHTTAPSTTDSLPIPSGKYLPSPKSTNTPTISLPARPPSKANLPTTYQQISTRKDYNLYVYIWLKHNMESEHASDSEKDLYSELVEKYGDGDQFQVSFLPNPLVHFLQDETLELFVKLVFRIVRETYTDREMKFFDNMLYRIISVEYWGFELGFELYPQIYNLITPTDREYTFWVMDRVKGGIATILERKIYNRIMSYFGDPKKWSSTSSPTLSSKPSSSPTTTPSPLRSNSFLSRAVLKICLRLYQRVKSNDPHLSEEDYNQFNYISRHYGPPEKWQLDTSKPWNRSMKSLFHGMSNFTLDISQWDVSGVTDFSHMLSGATFFSSDLRRWNVSHGENFSGMFNKAASFNSDLSGWDNSKGKSFTKMFSKATIFNSDVSGWDVSKATSFSSMFNGATKFNQNLCDWDFSGALVFGRSADKFCYGGANCFPSGGCRKLL